jgi:hypothetical protein
MYFHGQLHLASAAQRKLDEVGHGISKTHNHSIEYIDSDEMTSEKTQPNFLKIIRQVKSSCNLRHIRLSYTTQIFEL